MFLQTHKTLIAVCGVLALTIQPGWANKTATLAELFTAASTEANNLFKRPRLSPGFFAKTALKNPRFKPLLDAKKQSHLEILLKKIRSAKDIDFWDQGFNPPAKDIAHWALAIKPFAKLSREPDPAGQLLLVMTNHEVEKKAVKLLTPLYWADLYVKRAEKKFKIPRGAALDPFLGTMSQKIGTDALTPLLKGRDERAVTSVHQALMEKIEAHTAELGYLINSQTFMMALFKEAGQKDRVQIGAVSMSRSEFAPIVQSWYRDVAFQPASNLKLFRSVRSRNLKKVEDLIAHHRAEIVNTETGKKPNSLLTAEPDLPVSADLPMI